MSKTPRLLGIVLCGGQSKRMGTDKSELMHAPGKTFLQHAAERLSYVCNDVLLAGTQSAPQYDAIIDVIPGRGPAVGISSALQYAVDNGFDACFVTPVDMPDLSIEELILIKQKWQSQPHRLVCGVSGTDAKLQPLVAIYPVAFLDEILELSLSEDRSLQRWLQGRPYVSMILSAESCRNVNRPEDL